MRGDQLARQWRVIRSIEASPAGLAVAEIASFFHPFTLIALVSIHPYGNLVWVFNGTLFYGDLESLFGKVKSTPHLQALAFMDRMQSVFIVGIEPFSDYGKLRGGLTHVSRGVVEGRRIEMMCHGEKG